MREVNIGTFDTLNAMRDLEAAGIASKQAEAITNAVRDAVTEGTATKGDILRVDNDVNAGFASLNGKVDALAAETRADIKRLDGKIDALATETKAGIQALAKDTKADIARLETRMMATTIVVAGLVIAAIKYL